LRLASGIPAALLDSTLELLFPGHDTVTVVVERPTGGSQEIGQIHLYEEAAYLMFVHPGHLECVADACNLLEGLVRQAGERGAHYLLAAIEESNSIHYGLRQTGFRQAYTQKVWQVSPGQLPGKQNELRWRTAGERDYFSLASLYPQCVPTGLQPILPLKKNHLPDFILMTDRDVKGYAYLHRYPRAVFLYPYVSPALADMPVALASLIRSVAVHPKIFVVIPSFQGWLESARTRLAATTVMKQQILVKPIALWQKSAQPVRTRLAVNGQRSETSTPLAPSSKGE